MSDNKNDRKEALRAARENQVDFLYNLYLQDIPIGEENIEVLRKAGRIKQEALPEPKREPVFDNVNHPLLKIKNEANIRADASMDIVELTTRPDLPIEFITSEELEARRKEYGHIFEGRTDPIDSEEWKPKSTTEHEPDFVAWINSINVNGFQNRIHYKKFSLYCQQAYDWLAENKTSEDFEDEEQREDYRQEELRRCEENALYFLNKYTWYKEGDSKNGSGEYKYVALPNHEVIAYLDDCGYSVGMVKGRQQAVTTTIMSIDCRDVILKTNHFMKFITEDDEKAVEIFEDKLKYPFSRLPNWFRPIPLNERDNLFTIGYKEEKGKKEGAGSKIMVTVPKRTAIAGGAPQKVRVDEAGNIPILGIMIGNARPTMYMYDPVLKKLVLRRKLWYYGTGGEMAKGGGALQAEFMALYNAWMAGDYSSGIVPLFFNWWCRPGASQEKYDTEKKVAYAKGNDPSDPKAKQHITEFHQTWPETLEDVFMASAKTLLDSEYIENALKRIREAQAKSNVPLYQKGYFDPIYDYDSPTDEGSDVPFKIIGANFIPTSDFDARASTTILFHPNRSWRDRYFKGTDPIDTDTGQSKFASVVWDKHFKTIVAILDWRIADYPQVFLQSLLLNLYYDNTPQKKGIPELIESNRGSSYYQYVKTKGYEDCAVINLELPEYLQNKSAKNEGVGIDSHGDRTRQIVNIMFGMFKAYGMNFYHASLFIQSKSFTCKISDGGREMWGPIDKKYYTDDELWGGTYSYICSEMCFTHLTPMDVSAIVNTTKIEYRLVRGADGKLSRQAVKVMVTP